MIFAQLEINFWFNSDKNWSCYRPKYVFRPLQNLFNFLKPGTALVTSQSPWGPGNSKQEFMLLYHYVLYVLLCYCVYQRLQESWPDSKHATSTITFERLDGVHLVPNIYYNWLLMGTSLHFIWASLARPWALGTVASWQTILIPFDASALFALTIPLQQQCEGASLHSTSLACAWPLKLAPYPARGSRASSEVFWKHILVNSVIRTGPNWTKTWSKVAQVSYQKSLATKNLLTGL